MRQRIISALAGLMLLCVVIGMYNTIFLNFAIAAVCVISLREFLHGAGYANRLVNCLAYAYTATVPFLRDPWLGKRASLINYAFIVALMLVFLSQHKKVLLGEMAVTFLVSSLLCYSLTTLVACRDVFGGTVGLYYNLVVLIASWGTDTGAYFCGRFFGRHKLAPQISPNKTIEGAVGGAVIGVGAVLAFSRLYVLYLSYAGTVMTVHYLQLLCILPVLVVAGMLGDLSASAVKRQLSIKDFGHIMPGHGGALDRFDSVLAVAPVVYVVVAYFFPLAKLG